MKTEEYLGKINSSHFLLPLVIFSFLLFLFINHWGGGATKTLLDVKTGNIKVVANVNLSMEFITIPAGEFTMSSPVEGGKQYPPHTVYLDAYQIGRYEVTNGQFAQFIAAKPDYPLEGDWRWFYRSPENYPDNYPNYPVINVSWNDAKAFCDWAGCTLPTEAQWEKAARGTDARIYPWGNDWNTNNCNNIDGPIWARMLNIYGIRGTMPVGSFPAGASPYGAMNMGGNVSEWCADWYGETYYTTGGSPWNNPAGPASGFLKVIRGGSWFYVAPRLHCRCTFRDGGPRSPDIWRPYVGFRCVRKVTSPAQ